MEEFLTVLFMIHEKVTDFLANIIFTIPLAIESFIWGCRLAATPVYGEKIIERVVRRKDRKYTRKIGRYFLKNCSKVYRLKRRFQIYCCPIHVEW
jgi:hypothetical protein